MKNGKSVRVPRPEAKEVSGPENYCPEYWELDAFVLPKNVHTAAELIKAAPSLTLHEMGVTPPKCIPKHLRERFELGFRIGLTSNTPQKTLLALPAEQRKQEGCGKYHSAYRPSIARGFCWAKCYWNKFFHRHKLSANGDFFIKDTVIE